MLFTLSILLLVFTNCDLDDLNDPERGEEA